MSIHLIALQNIVHTTAIGVRSRAKFLKRRMAQLSNASSVTSQHIHISPNLRNIVQQNVFIYQEEVNQLGTKGKILLEFIAMKRSGIGLEIRLKIKAFTRGLEEGCKSQANVLNVIKKGTYNYQILVINIKEI